MAIENQHGIKFSTKLDFLTIATSLVPNHSLLQKNNTLIPVYFFTKNYLFDHSKTILKSNIKQR